MIIKPRINHHNDNKDIDKHINKDIDNNNK